ncbi:MAG: DUF305 domain-containing protein [Sinimarinibacterium sp.]
MALRAFACLLVGVLLIGAATVTVRHVQNDVALRARLEPGPVDIGFAQSMGVHHQQAIAMAQMLLDGRPTPLAGLARAIVYAQLAEIGEMRGWLRLWEKPWLPVTRSMDWMLLGDAPPDAVLQKYLLDCRRSPTGMTGMATDVELGRLRTLEGRPRDELFLKLMLQHHRGGIPMAQFAAHNARLAAVRTLAANMAVEQSEEVARILMTLNAMGVAPPG